MHVLGFRSASVFGTVLALSGCGGPPTATHPDVAPAAGVVTYHGSPVAGATVALFSEQTKSKGWVLASQTDPKGRFEIVSIFAPGTEIKGAPAGEYTVVVTKFEAAAAAAPKDLQDYEEQYRKQVERAATGIQPEVSAPRAAIPDKYARDASSPLRVNIHKAGNSSIDVKLED